MRTRDLSVLTPDVKDRLRAWLIHEGGDPGSCPFPLHKCHICRALLPGLPSDNIVNGIDKNPCPCDYYSREYVIKIAKKLTK